jgi:hypothetical protein
VLSLAFDCFVNLLAGLVGCFHGVDRKGEQFHNVDVYEKQ